MFSLLWPSFTPWITDMNDISLDKTSFIYYNTNKWIINVVKIFQCVALGVVNSKWKLSCNIKGDTFVFVLHSLFLTTFILSLQLIDFFFSLHFGRISWHIYFKSKKWSNTSSEFSFDSEFTLLNKKTWKQFKQKPVI